MNDDYLTIGQMAELNHVSSQTLRLYDKKGLLSPAYQGKATATATTMWTSANGWISYIP